VLCWAHAQYHGGLTAAIRLLLLVVCGCKTAEEAEAAAVCFRAQARQKPSRKAGRTNKYQGSYLSGQLFL